MIIWSGFGIFVAIIGSVALVGTKIVSEELTKNERFTQENPWVILVGMSVAALLTYGLHKLLSLKKPRLLIDRETGKGVELRANHSLFFIPVKCWPIIFILLGFVFMLVIGSE